MIMPNSNLLGINRTGSREEDTRLGKHRLDRNERNFPFSDEFMARIRTKMTGELLAAYPEPWHTHEKLAGRLGVPPDRLMLAPGSEQAIKAVFETYMRPKDRVLLHFPSFAMYEVYAETFQAGVESQRYDSGLHFDWEEYIARIRPGLRLVLAENPNGFIGAAAPLPVLRALVEKAHEHGVIALVDEAYFHFHDETCAGWIDEFDNLIITRTFSKAFGLAGLRIGYVLSNPTTIMNLMKVKPAYEITSVAGMVACDLLDHPEEMADYLGKNRENLESLRRGLTELGIACSQSRANFLAVRLGNTSVADALRRVLYDRGILIRRPFREPELSAWVRISTAEAAIQDVLLSELKTVLGR
jgi:histidinol-phosphate aminotransferase